jgi:formate dehydrogenase major subunit
VSDVENAEVIFLIGANPTSNHPVAATWMKNAAKRGAKLIYADPRRSELARHAWRYPAVQADTDVAMLNAMIHTIIEEGWSRSFVKDRPAASKR